VAGQLTVRARSVFECARDEAAAMKHHYVGTEHLLLGLLGEPYGMAGRALVGLGVEVEVVRRDVQRIVGLGDEPVAEDETLPLTPRMQEIVALADRAAQTQGTPLTGTKHLLLGLVREGNGVANVVLADHGVSTQEVEHELGRLSAGPN
jgi:ATP-dependent Clp protease ATP-binding subunit ClpC